MSTTGKFSGTQVSLQLTTMIENKSSHAPIPRSLRALVTNLIDYAGLFPPASLPLPEVVARYSNYRQSASKFALARIIIPAGQLTAFAELANPIWDSESTWRVSALLASPEAQTSDFENGLRAIEDFNRVQQTGALIDVIETKANHPTTIERYAQAIPNDIQTYWELPHATVPDDMLEQLCRSGVDRHRAKIRTGGIKPEMIPTLEQVAQFIKACAQHRVPFKATAGLHHPLRRLFPLTYEPQSICAVMHGFLNVFLAACRAWTETISLPSLIDMLQADMIEDICFDDEGASGPTWQLSLAQIEDARRSFAMAFGSCSFTEPIDDLIALRLLTESSRVC